MLIAIPKEIKDNEARVALSPSGVREFTKNGHEVHVETNAGVAIGFTDEDYVNAGAHIADDKEELYGRAELIVKVKEPQKEEVQYFQEGQILFSYLHLAAEEELTRDLLAKKMVAISYETVVDNHGALPLLKPMSEVAGRLSVQVGASCMQKNNGGLGMLLGGVTGVSGANVVVIGGGVVGTNAAFIASGMGADVTILDKSLKRIDELDQIFSGRVRNLYSNYDILEEYVQKADLLVGAVLVPGAEAPKLVTKELVAKMKKGSVIVDVAIDQGGCFETSRPTSHSEPTYEVSGVTHYCVTNMPAAAARTATRALENATMPYIARLANLGYEQAFREDPGFLEGLNTYGDKVTLKAVADQFGLNYLDPNTIC